NYLTRVRQSARQFSRVAGERFAIARIILMNVHLSEFAQIGQADFGSGIKEATRWRDYQYTTNARSRPGEGVGIGKLPAKIESAQKSEHFANGRRFAAS